MINQLYNLKIEHQSNSKVQIHIPKIDVLISIAEGFPTFNVCFDKKVLCFFREGEQNFTQNRRPENYILSKVFSFEGDLLHRIPYPKIEKKIPENKYKLEYWHASFVKEGINVSFRSRTWQIGDFQSVFSFKENEYGSYMPAR